MNHNRINAGISETQYQVLFYDSVQCSMIALTCLRMVPATMLN